MPDKQIINYIKNETNGELLYIIAVTCIQRLVSLDKAAAVKAILDSGTASLLTMIGKE